MAIVWGGWSGHMRVGIEVGHDPINWDTNAVNVAASVYIQCEGNWSFNDAQRIDLSGNAGGAWNFQNTLGANQVLHIGGAFVPGPQTVYYGGGPQYYFKAQLSGHYQGAAPFVEVWFNLPPKPPFFPVPPTVWADEVTASSARIINWPGADNGSPIVEYHTQLSTSSSFSTIARDYPGGTHYETGLAVATRYYIRGRTRNGVGWSGWSATEDFTTGQTVPGAPVLTIGTTTENSAQLSWTTPASGGSTITSYDLQFAGDASFTNAKIVSYGKVNSGSLINMAPGTTYYMRMRAVNGVGAGPWSAAKNTTTLAGTPTIVAPLANAVLTDGIIDVTVQAQGIASGRTITVQVSSSSTFASDVRTVTLDPTGPSADNRYRLTAANQYLATGTWYARANVKNNATNYTTPWSATVTFTQSHAPTATVTKPTAGTVYQYAALTAFTWGIKDSAKPNDWQTAYRLQVENNATGEVVYDSQKTALVTTATQESVTVNVAIASTLKAVGLRWRVMVWDRADTPSAWTGYGLFTLADPPVIAVVTPPSGSSVDNGAPTFSWTVSIPSGGTQVRAVVRVFDAATNEQVWTGTVSGSATSIKPQQIILRNANNYYVTVEILDSTGLTNTVTSPFSTSYSSPNPIRYSVNPLGADELGYIDIDWMDANADDLFAAWKVYRRTQNTPWQPIATITNQNVRNYHDYMLKAGETYSYSVTQVATRSGSLLESPVGYYVVDELTVPEGRWFSMDLTYYWIVDPNSPDDSVRLVNVVNDDTTLEFEQASYNIIGRGRHVDYGDELGYTGTITCEVRIPERPSRFRLAIENLRRNQSTYYLRTPFGQLFSIALGNISWSPLAGVGTAEMGTMGISYQEVR